MSGTMNINNFIGKIHLGDCLDIMRDIPDKSIDLILTDPPYGTTSCEWDQVIPFDKMWEGIKRLRKDNTAILLFGTEPFSSKLRMSNIKEFKYDWIWEKSRMTDFFQATYRPMKSYEVISVFYKSISVFNPIKWKIDDRFIERRKSFNVPTETGMFKGNKKKRKKDDGWRNPHSILSFNSISTEKTNHSTEKPIKLIEYLIETYSNENSIVLDFAAGSGTTALACIETNRRFICVEKDEDYFKIASKRIDDAQSQLNLFP
jgi:site-specific DNA-methyltransferase (adenine-specific)